jgi:RHS repeat-associated protein
MHTKFTLTQRDFGYFEVYPSGFNGKENDNEIKGVGNQQDYGMRTYDPRLGKFLSVDPLTKDYPWYTPYQFAGNKPIWAVDLDGEEEFLHTDYFTINNQLLGTKIQIIGAYGMSKSGNGQLDVQTVHYQRATIDANGKVSSVNYTGSMIGSYANCTNAFATVLERNIVTGRNESGSIINSPIVNGTINIRTVDPSGVNPSTVSPAVSISSPILFENKKQDGNGKGIPTAVKSNVFSTASGSSISEPSSQQTFYFLNSSGNQRFTPNANRVLPSLGNQNAVPANPANRTLLPGSDQPIDNRIGSPTEQQ